MGQPSFRTGVFFAFSAYFLWGFLPLYWKLLSAIPSLHILSFRIIFSMFLVSAVLFAMKNTSWLKFYKDRRKALLLTMAALTVTINWGFYIWAVNSGHTIQTSLGYYITPLISIVLGLCFFREKLTILQAIAFGLAFIGVLILTLLTGKLPWVSLVLAFSFGIYGLLKKTVQLTALESLGVETLIASPLGLLLLLIPFRGEGSFPNFRGLSYFLELPVHTLLLFTLCGLVTSLPLFLFSKGAKMLPLSTLGFIQFVSPTLTFLTGLFIFGEPFSPSNFIAFGFIWSAAILYIISLWKLQNAQGSKGQGRK
jgi:chloramphenicol-sensitive protein RarD